ncbi:MAG: hypothetical protein NVSMB55_02930 [Mycobacteriales bacterium]
MCCSANTITNVTAAASAWNAVSHLLAWPANSASSKNPALTPAAAAVAPLLDDSLWRRCSWRLAQGRWSPTAARRSERTDSAGWSCSARSRGSMVDGRGEGTFKVYPHRTTVGRWPPVGIVTASPQLQRRLGTSTG